MNVTLFITILTIGSAVCTLLTEAVKKAFYNAGKEASPNVLALIDAVVVGCGGTAVLYILLGIDWTVNNIISLFLVGICVWIGSMVGYDKIIQLIKQVTATDSKEEE